MKRAREIRKFHVAVVKQRLRDVQKSVKRVQRYFFANLDTLLFAVAVAKTPYCCHPEILLPW